MDTCIKTQFENIHAHLRDYDFGRKTLDGRPRLRLPRDALLTDIENSSSKDEDRFISVLNCITITLSP